MKRAIFLAVLAAGLLVATDAQARHHHRGARVTTTRQGGTVTTAVTGDAAVAVPEAGKTVMLLAGGLAALAAVRLRLANPIRLR